MADYESLLLGGKQKKTGVKGMTYEDRLKNLEKARAVRAKNLANKKKSMCGKGQYNQDYVDESQINYAGSPLDMYYLGNEREMAQEKRQRGEIGDGMKKKGRKPKHLEMEESDEEMEGGRMCGGKMHGGVYDRRMYGGDMSYMKGSMHTGMSMPTEQQFINGGKIKKGRKKTTIEEISGGSIDIPEAIKTLAVLASKFGLKLVK